MTNQTFLLILVPVTHHEVHQSKHELNLIPYLHRHYYTVYLLSGLNVNILLSKSAAWGLIFGKSLSQPCFVRLGNDFMYFIAF